MKVEEDAAKAKYTFSEIYDYVVHKTYPSHADKLYKHELRKRSKFSGRRTFILHWRKRELRNLAWWSKVRRRGGE